jgi:hypothetical protein
MSEWEHIFKGEPVDLDKMLSSLHCITIDPERKVSIGEAEISIGGAEAKRKVETSSEWATAWRSASRATALSSNIDNVNWSNMEIISRGYLQQRGRDPTVRSSYLTKGSEMRSGEDKPCYSPTTIASCHYTPPHFRMTKSSITRTDKEGIATKQVKPKGEVCLRFNSQNGCRFTEAACKYQHTCQSCGQSGHGKPSCGKGN